MSLDVHRLTPAQIPWAMTLVEQTGWNQLESDWSRIIQLSPNGCFYATYQGRNVGTVTTTTYGRHLAWIGMMLVDERFRQLGIGRKLMQTAIDYLQGLGVKSIKLDATPVGRILYTKLGFVDNEEFLRWQRPASIPNTELRETKIAPTKFVLTEKANCSADLLELVIQQDSLAVGIERRLLMNALVQDSAILSINRSFGMLRHGRTSDYIGPVVGNLQEVRQLLPQLTRLTNRSILWDVPSRNHEAKILAGNLGFAPFRPLYRMTLGQHFSENSPMQFAFADLATG